ncbi:MAG: NAD-dependent DNA ligase LigA [Deltaproteobacteria bacterium]|nr:NAD-dependent DNA ligase LigA [Deltaproteobacteria bacterium]
MARLPPLETLSTDDLERLIAHHNHLYHDLHRPEISDTDYDRLIRRLRRLRPASPLLSDLGETVAGTAVAHLTPMLSLDKAYSRDEVLAFIETPRTKKRKIVGALVLSPKIDGVACSLRYDARGRLAQAATRGDGERGEDVTANARRVQAIPQQLDGGAVEVRGELYLARSRFEEKFAGTFANARNLTAGAIKQKDPQRTADYGLSFFAYDLLETPGGSPARDLRLGCEWDKRRWLEQHGFAVPPMLRVESADFDAVWDAVQRTAQAARDLDCDADGVVIKADDLAEQRRHERTAHHPTYAIAFKFQGDTGESTLQSVEWSVSRTGRITPVAIVDPVVLSGASVSRASLHNLEYFEKLGVTDGCLVQMTRRGEVIPHVERVVQAGDRASAVPGRCPSCGAPTERRDKFLFCTRPDTCHDALVAALDHFCKVFEIDGFGWEHLDALVRQGLVRRSADFFELTAEQLLSLKESALAPAPDQEPKQVRIGEVLANKLVDAIAARRNIPLATFLVALGIEDLGPVMADKLVDHLGALDPIRRATAEQLAQIEGLGEERSRNIADGLRQLGPRIDELLRHVQVTMPRAAAPSDHPLSGKSVVFTGGLIRLDRKSAQKRVRAVGGTTPGSVVKDLDYLVVGDEGSPLRGDNKKSSKQQSADRYNKAGAGIQIITEQRFFELLEGKGEK